MKKYEAGLRSMVAKDEKLSIIRLCEITDRKLSDFKYRYKTMGGFICQLIEHNLNQMFRKNMDVGFSKLISDLLKMMYEEKEYYYALFKLLSTGRVQARMGHNIAAYRSVEKIFLRELEQYVKKSGLLRMRDIEGCASHICSRIQVWVFHGLEDTPQTIYHELRASIGKIEAARMGEV